jgi:ribosomal protein L13
MQPSSSVGNTETKPGCIAMNILRYTVFVGMIPHKTKRGMEALNRLKVFEGIPPPYDRVIGIMDTVEAL